jgi:hypothetical protein
MFEPEAHFIERRIKNIATSLSDMANDRIEPWPTKTNYAMTQEEHLKVPNSNYLAFWPFHLTYYLPAIKPQWALPLWASSLIFIAGFCWGGAILGWGWLSCPRFLQNSLQSSLLTDEAFRKAWPEKTAKKQRGQTDQANRNTLVKSTR